MTTINEIPSMEQSIEQEIKSKHIPSKFVYTDHVFKGLELAQKSGENIILWGMGGFGKSEIVNKYFRDLGVIPYVKSLGSGTTIDALLGGVDLGLFSHGIIDHKATALAKKEALDAGLDINDVQPIYIKKPGAIEYLIENSFMNHEYVVFEEALDAPDFVLEALKDILTSKEFRNGTQRFPLKTKMIVICTNKSRADFATDNASLKALMERFVMEVKVEWPAYNAENYSHMFKECFGKTNKTLAYILGELAKDKIIISPRTAVKVLLGMEEAGTDYMGYVAEFTSERAKAVVQESIKKYKSVARIDELTDKVDEAIKAINTIDFSGGFQTINLPVFKEALQTIKRSKEELSKTKTDDELMKKVTMLDAQWNQILEKNMNELQKLTGLDQLKSK
jgi:MoxR-like ATPase